MDDDARALGLEINVAIAVDSIRKTHRVFPENQYVNTKDFLSEVFLIYYLSDIPV